MSVRRFESEEQRGVYAAVYEADYWKTRWDRACRIIRAGRERHHTDDSDLEIHGSIGRERR